jgi:hypothetical protein
MNRKRYVLTSKYAIGDEAAFISRRPAVNNMISLGTVVEITFSTYRVYYEVKLHGKEDDYDGVTEERIFKADTIKTLNEYNVCFTIGQKVIIHTPSLKGYESTGYISKIQITERGVWYVIAFGDGTAVGEREENIASI